MKRFLLTTAAVLAMAALPASGQAQDVPALKLKYASHVPGNNVVSEVDKFFVERLKEKSGGRIQAEIFWNRALGKQQEMLPLISAGALDFTTLETAQYGETPLIGFMNALPLVHFDARKLVDLSRKLYETSPGIQAEMKRVGAKALWVRHLPNYQLLCRKPFETIAELKGAKLRSYGAYVPVMWQAMGANAVNVVASELYDGLSKGTFDCAYLPPAFLTDYKLYEPAKYLIDIPLGMIEFAPTLVPTVVWERWPESVRKIMMEASRETEEFGVRHIEANSGEAIALMQKNGVKVVAFRETEQLRKLVPNMLDVWLQKQKEGGRGAAAEQIVALARAHYAQ
jgi:TRAP-type C4-dicarboxylate transport system substrate-binding protein